MRFYSSAAGAEGAGFRPCLRCRPERAPGLSSVDAVSRLVGAAISGIEEHALSSAKVGELAASLGVSDRHLRRVTESELGVSPIELAQTQRLLLAKRLLADTRMSQTEIAFASGFGSVRRFNALFKSRYGLSPRELRGAPPRACTANWNSVRRSPGAACSTICARVPSRAWRWPMSRIIGELCASISTKGGFRYRWGRRAMR
jgi:methylphosphotriester-DNA--protein-cysteine methyltransferase